jgi:uncharacterized protein (TIGR00290 family)
MRPRAAISWSGGKDSCAALLRTHADLEVVAMVTMFDEEAARSRSHGLRPDVLSAQAARLRLRQVVGRCTWPTYNAAFGSALDELRADAVTHVVFGDILFPEHRQWAENMCRAHGLVAVEPLFGSSTTDLFLEWTRSGADARIVAVRAEQLDRTWLGRRLERGMLEEFAALDVDPCAERGEYHTVVTDCALFSEPISLTIGGTAERSGCFALDVMT